MPRKKKLPVPASAIKVLDQGMPEPRVVEKCTLIETNIDGMTIGRFMILVDERIAEAVKRFTNQDEYHTWASDYLVEKLQYVAKNSNFATDAKPRKKPGPAKGTPRVKKTPTVAEAAAGVIKKEAGNEPAGN